MTLEVGTHHLAEHGFSGSVRRAVIVGEVEMGYAMIKSAAKHGSADVVVIGATEVLPQTQTDCRKLQPRASTSAVRHGVISIRCSFVGTT